MKVWIWCSWQHDIALFDHKINERDDGFNIYDMTEEELTALQSLYDVDFPLAYSKNPDKNPGEDCRIGRKNRAPTYYLGKD